VSVRNKPNEPSHLLDLNAWVLEKLIPYPFFDIVTIKLLKAFLLAKVCMYDTYRGQTFRLSEQWKCRLDCH